MEPSKGVCDERIKMDSCGGARDPSDIPFFPDRVLARAPGHKAGSRAIFDQRQHAIFFLQSSVHCRAVFQSIRFTRHDRLLHEALGGNIILPAWNSRATRSMNPWRTGHSSRLSRQ
jgi:hypothetical protein